MRYAQLTRKKYSKLAVVDPRHTQQPPTSRTEKLAGPLSFVVLHLCFSVTGQSYPDPAAGAASSFIHRLSEISSLEGETVRQEKIRKLRKSRKQD